jgi:hypothetical protein
MWKLSHNFGVQQLTIIMLSYGGIISSIFITLSPVHSLKNTLKIFGFLWLSISLTIVASSAMFPRSAMAQNSSKTPNFEEDHAGDAMKWLQNFINPMNEANYDSLRKIGYDQLMHMDNHPAMSTLSSAAWTEVATSDIGKVSGRGSCVAFDSHNTIYYGVTKGGLWKTTNAGANWTSMSDTWATLDVDGVAVDPINQNTVYAGTGAANGVPDDLIPGYGDTYGVGVYKSEDGGLNWTLLPNSPNVATTQLEVNPVSSNLIYLASSGGVSLSDDSGTTWSTTLSLNGYTSIVFDPHNPAIVYAAGGGLIEKSIDSGNTWTALPSGYPTGTFMVLGMSLASSDSIYLSTGNGNSDGSTANEGGSTLALSTDAGETWTIKSENINYLGQQAFYANAMAVNPQNPANVIVGGLNIWSSTQGGANLLNKTDWLSEPGSSNYSHADIHVLKYNPYTNVLYVMTDGGIFYSDNNGLSWASDMNHHLGTFSFVGGDMAITSDGTPDFFCAGAQDNGLSGFNYESDTTYRSIQGGDGGTMFVSPYDGETTFGTYVYEVLYRSEDRGIDWDAGGADQDNPQNILGSAILNEQTEHPGETPFYIKYDVYDQDPDVVAVCGPVNVFLEQNGTIGPNSYPQVTNVGAGTAISGEPVAVHIASSDDDYIYIGTQSEYFYYSTDITNITWTPAYKPGSTTTKMTFGGQPQDITTDPNNAENVFMVVAGTTSKHFWYSPDNGVTWTSPATNLPALNYRRIAMDPNGILYIGSDYGVLRSGDTGKHWYSVADGLPMAMVSSLQIRGNYLVAATYGRGMYYVDLTTLPPLGTNSVATVSASNSGIAISAVYPSIITTSQAQTNIDYTLPSNEQATLTLYDVLGRQERVLINQFVSQGDHELTTDLSGIATGQHYLVLTAGGTSVTKSIVIE